MHTRPLLPHGHRTLTERTEDVQKTSRTSSELLCTFNLHPVSTGLFHRKSTHRNVESVDIAEIICREKAALPLEVSATH